MTESKIIPNDWMVPPVFHTRLGEHAGRQRIMLDSGHLLLILHKPPILTGTKREARLFWRSPEGIWKASGTVEDGLKILYRHLEQYASIIEQLENRLEQAKQAEDFFLVMRDLSPVLRTIRNMHTTLQQARDSIAAAREIIILRDQAYTLARTAELLETEAKYSLDFTMAQRAEEQARLSQHIAESGYRLNLIAGLFLPITALAAIFSMKFSSGLENIPGMFWLVLGLGIVIGFRLKGSLQKWQK